MLDEIKAALEEAFDLPVYYGSSAPATGQEIYDYIVFWRKDLDWKVNSKGDYTAYYNVSLVRQDFIPEDDETKVIDTLRKIKGLKEQGEVTFDYLYKPGTALGMEVANYSFIHAVKRT